MLSEKETKQNLLSSSVKYTYFFTHSYVLNFSEYDYKGKILELIKAFNILH